MLSSILFYLFTVFELRLTFRLVSVKCRVWKRVCCNYNTIAYYAIIDG